MEQGILVVQEPPAHRFVELRRRVFGHILADIGEDRERAGGHDRDESPERDELSKPFAGNAHPDNLPDERSLSRACAAAPS